MDNRVWLAYSKIYEYLMGDLPNGSTYNDRIVSQKIGYLCVSTGIYLGDLKFFWHRRGPYSRVLAAVVRHIDKNKDDIQEQCSNVKLTETVIPKLELIKSIIESRPADCSEIYWLEICASMKYLSKTLPDENYSTVAGTLLNRKQWLADYKRYLPEAFRLVSNL